MNREDILTWQPNPKELLTWLSVGALLGPVVVIAAREAVVDWLLKYQILVEKGTGVSSIPWLNVDVPARTIILTVLLFIVALGVIRLWRRALLADARKQAERERIARERAGGIR